MKKVLGYFLVIFSLFLLLEGVKASEYSCKYSKLEIKVVAPTHPDFGDLTKGTINNNNRISIKVIDGDVKSKNVTAPAGSKEILNWKSEKGGFSAKKYADGEACPPYLLTLKYSNGIWEYFAFETIEHAGAIIKEKQNVEIAYSYKLVEGPQLSSNDKNSESSESVVNLKTFVCVIDGYVIEYNTNGKIVSAKSKDSLENAAQYFGSYFQPKSASECPAEGTAEVGFINDGKTLYVGNIGEIATSPESDLNTETPASSCLDYKTPESCKASSSVNCSTWGCNTTGGISCVWNETKYGDYCNVDKLLYVRCGDAKDIPYQVPSIVSFAINFLKILTPIILIAVSLISLLKALSSSNEDEIKKAQKGLVRKIIAAVMVFLVITITQFVVMKVADSGTTSDENDKVETDNLSDCLNCLLNNNCSETVYYKTNIGGEYIETPVTQIKK